MQYIQTFVNLFSSIFIALRYWNKPDPFQSFATIKSGFRLINNFGFGKKTLLLAPIRVSPMSNLFEGLIGYFFKLKGWEVKALMCDQAVSYCDNISYVDNNKRFAICALCKKEQERFCKTFDFEFISIKDNINKQVFNDIHNYIEKYEISDSSNQLLYKDYNLTDIVNSAVTRYTLRSEVNFESDLVVIKGFFKTAIVTIEAMKNSFDNIAINRTIMSHGTYSQWGSALSYLQKNDITTYVWARGYVGQGSLIFGLNRSYLEDTIRESKEVYQNINYSKDELFKSKIYFNEKRMRNSKIEYVNYYSILSQESNNSDPFFDDLRSRFNNVYGMFTNIPWDGQIYNKSEGFPNTYSYLNSVIEWFVINSNCALVIRAHPAEADLEEGRGSEKIYDVLNRNWPNGLPSNIFFLEPQNSITSYLLSDNIDAAIVYGSTIGLEIAISGVPVIQAGNFYTSSKEILTEVLNKQELHEKLDFVKNGGKLNTKIMIDNALRFGCYWIFKKHITDTSVNLERLIFKSYNFSSILEFENDSTLNFLYNSMIQKLPIINSTND
jgi:hypothetical protein